ncbi:type II toxin-antitoxin system PemK/MazF family toxin [Ilumatobacter sp.]|uniref:type II toxin-antitoxin system PemK/MazF family toxin n=1 Tax=Ilumatobacter sp. TaxID=1967498 RepID=UPI003AF5CF9E
MKRGEIWTAAAGSGYAGKPRPVVIIQDDLFDATASVTVCAFTTDDTDAPLFRIPVDADEETGICQPSRLMVDKITTVPRSKLGERIGRLPDDDMARLARSVVVFLGLATP